MKQKPTIFALARNNQPTPMSELLEKIRNIELPPKSPELLEAESSLSAERDQRARLVDEQSKLGAQYRRVQETGLGDLPPIRSIYAYNDQIAQADDKIHAARQRCEALSDKWRHEAQKLVAAEVEPLRAALHDLVQQLDDGMSVIKELAIRTSRLDVGSPWICREAEQLLYLLRVLKEKLILDRTLAREGR